MRQGPALLDQRNDDGGKSVSKVSLGGLGQDHLVQRQIRHSML